MERLFVYGTLRDESLLVALLGRRLRRKDATLPHHRREVHPTGAWPLALRDPSATVEGTLLYGLRKDDFARLDGYESVQEGLYSRVATHVIVDDSRVRAWVYVR